MKHERNLPRSIHRRRLGRRLADHPPPKPTLDRMPLFTLSLGLPDLSLLVEPSTSHAGVTSVRRCHLPQRRLHPSAGRRMEETHRIQGLPPSAWYVEDFISEAEEEYLLRKVRRPVFDGYRFSVLILCFPRSPLRSVARPVLFSTAMHRSLTMSSPNGPFFLFTNAINTAPRLSPSTSRRNRSSWHPQSDRSS